MNRAEWLYLLTFLSMFLFDSCTKEVTLSNKSDEQGKLLAGEKGTVKIWRLIGIHRAIWNEPRVAIKFKS